LIKLWRFQLILPIFGGEFHSLAGPGKPVVGDAIPGSLVVPIDRNLQADLLEIVKTPAGSFKSWIDQLYPSFSFADPT
jgi:hypothetical protein